MKQKSYRKNTFSNQKLIRGLISLVILFVVLQKREGGLFSFWNSKPIAIEDTVAEGEMKVSFLDVGQGDATLIQTKEKSALIDAGNNRRGEDVVEDLKKRGIDHLDYLILTHPDSDHIGGADYVLRAFSVGEVLLPEEEKDTQTYREVIEEIEKKEIPVRQPEVGENMNLGDARMTILSPFRIGEEDSNQSSIGVKLVHGKKSFVMCGDADVEMEEEMIRKFSNSLECDVLKCSHHGSSTSTSSKFLKYTNPTWAVISCGRENPYGHPHREVLSRLKEEDIQYYRTDKLGTIEAVSDGEKITWKKGNR